MKLVDKLKENLIGNVYVQDEIDNILGEEKYYPVEFEENEDEGVFKYSNGRSQIWIKYAYDNMEYLVTDVTYCIKKKGKNPIHALKNPEDIKKLLDYFKDREKYDELMITTLDLLLGRRIYDTMSLKWSDLFEENGNKKNVLDTLIEQKTGKVVEIRISGYTWDCIDRYIEQLDINPMQHYNEDIFMNDKKRELSERRLKEHMSDEEYNRLYYDINKAQCANYRYVLTAAGKYLGFKNFSTHSLRKTFGYWAHQLNPYDPDNVDVLQIVFNHASRIQTLTYIDVMEEKGNALFDSVASFIEDTENGKEYDIKNLPVISLETSDLRDALEYMYKMGKEGKDALQSINEALDKLECVRVGK